KLITVDVEGAPNAAAADKLARTIANSPLVKTAIAGSDPNWGRVLCAAGYAGVPFDPAIADVYMQGLKVCQGGLATKFSEAELTKKLDAPECSVRLVLRGKGKATARIWTCDFTEDYIRINASYRT
ncbi:MAG: bifunctional ornithine acetyltransferase/N-acetylglutamate synthase, partial [Acidobacteriota bacterium]